MRAGKASEQRQALQYNQGELYDPCFTLHGSPTHEAKQILYFATAKCKICLALKPLKHIETKTPESSLPTNTEAAKATHPR